MDKPKAIKNSECGGCLKVKPLLMPVGYAPGWPFIVYTHYCMDCRMELYRTDQRYCWLVEDMIHSKSEKSRGAFDEWKHKTI